MTFRQNDDSMKWRFGKMMWPPSRFVRGEGTHVKKASRFLRGKRTHVKKAPRLMRGEETHNKKQPDYVGLCPRSARVGAMRAHHPPKFLTFYLKSMSNKNSCYSRHSKGVLGYKYGGVTHNLKKKILKNKKKIIDLYFCNNFPKYFH